MRYHGAELEASTIGDLARARRNLGDKVFVTIAGEELTFADLDSRSNEFANGLRSVGISKGDVVATCMYNSITHLLIWFGCAKIGAVWAPINVGLTGGDLEYTVIDSGARVLILDAEKVSSYQAVHDAVHAQLPDLIEVVDLDEPAGTALPIHGIVGSSTEISAEVHGSDPACITYTGGSTGMPKGVVLPHLLFIATGQRYVHAVDPKPEDVHLTVGQLFHTTGQQLGIIGPLYAGISTSMPRWFSASRYWARVREAGATVIDLVGPMLAAVVAQTPADRGGDHDVRLGVGIATGQIRREIRDEFEQRFGVELLEVYGLTETGVLACTEIQSVKRAGSCGDPKTSGWLEVAIVDEQDAPVATGEEGRIVLRPLEPFAFMLGYHGKPDVTVASWRNLWFHTGDLGRLDEDGFLYFSGREAHWIRHKGENVSAFEVEKSISAHQAVADCAVVGVPAEIGEEDIKAYVQLAPGASLKPADLIDWCGGRLSYFKVPRYVEFIDELPRSISKNELERHVLRDRGIGAAWDAGERRSPSRPSPA